MSAPLRLRLLLPHVLLGGGETAMLDVAEGLRDEPHGFDVHVGAFDQNERYRRLPNLYDELRERFGAVSLLRERWELRPFLADADAVLWYGVVPQVPRALLSLTARPASLRVVHTDRGADGEDFHRRWHRAIDATVAVHPGVARRIPGAVFIPNTAGERFLQGPARDVFPGSPRKTLGFLGRLSPLKNVPWLIENGERLDVDLLIQGLDTVQIQAAELAEMARQRGLAERVRFLPAGRDVGTLLKSVDALVVASRHEGFPRVVIEAGMLGVPVIATRVGALPELFADAILFVDSEDGVPSAESMRAALPHLGRPWGERLRARVENLCAPAAVIGRYADLIRATVPPAK